MPGVANYCILYSQDGENWITGRGREVQPPIDVLTDTIGFGGVPAGHYWLRAYAADDVGNVGAHSDPIEVDVPWGLHLPVMRREIP